VEKATFHLRRSGGGLQQDEAEGVGLGERPVLERAIS
jgi:hypothetical protein